MAITAFSTFSPTFFLENHTLLGESLLKIFRNLRLVQSLLLLVAQLYSFFLYFLYTHWLLAQAQVCIEERSNGKPAKTKFQAPAFNKKFNAHLIEIKEIEANPYSVFRSSLVRFFDPKREDHRP